jgi:hypothetical protein
LKIRSAPFPAPGADRGPCGDEYLAVAGERNGGSAFQQVKRVHVAGVPDLDGDITDPAGADDDVSAAELAHDDRSRPTEERPADGPAVDVAGAENLVRAGQAAGSYS